MDDELKEAIKGGASLSKVPEDEMKKREEEKKKRMEELEKIKAKLAADGQLEE